MGDTEKLQKDIDALQTWEKDWLMSFNPAKCEVMHATNKKHPIKHDYTIHGQVLRKVDTAKYLGCNINRTLSWNPHISAITKKANSTLGFLRRNIGSCPPQVKKQAYTTFVRPVLEYSSTVWSPHTKTAISQLEAVQRRGARFISSDYQRESSPTAMLATMNLPTLQQRRDLSRVSMMYKIVHQVVAIPAAPLLCPSSHIN